MLIEEMGHLAADLLLPNASPDHDRLFDKKHPDRIRVPLVEAGGFKRRLNASGWFGEEVVAGGLITQGKAQSLLSMKLGAGSSARRTPPWGSDPLSLRLSRGLTP